MNKIFYQINQTASGVITWAANESFNELIGKTYQLHDMEAASIVKLSDLSSTTKLLLSAIAGAVIQHLIDQKIDPKLIFETGTFTVLKPEKACGAAIIQDGKLLLEYQTNGHWSFPKGHVEPSETEVETALREIKEETGLDVDINDSIRVDFSYVITSQAVDKEVVIFAAKLKNPNQTLTKQDSEIAELRWVPLDEAASIFNRESYRDAWLKLKSQLTTSK